MKINLKKLLLFILVPLSLGALVGILTSSNSNIDSILPPWIFPIVWTIIYILMGLSSYIVYEKTNEIPKIYIIQLATNLLWSFVFFTFNLKTLAFIWILFLILLVIIMIRDFLSKDKLAGYLQIIYLIWLFIAAILNLLLIV